MVFRSALGAQRFGESWCDWRKQGKAACQDGFAHHFAAAFLISSRLIGIESMSAKSRSGPAGS